MSQDYVGIVGSRFPNKMNPHQKAAVIKQIKDYIDSLPAGTVVVSGGASSGADYYAEKFAQASPNLSIMTFPAKWRRDDGSVDRGAGFARNSHIVEMSDRIVAFWDGQSNGTNDTITKAKKAKKKVQIIRWPEIEESK